MVDVENYQSRTNNLNIKSGDITREKYLYKIIEFQSIVIKFELSSLSLSFFF